MDRNVNLPPPRGMEVPDEESVPGESKGVNVNGTVNGVLNGLIAQISPGKGMRRAHSNRTLTGRVGSIMEVTDVEVGELEKGVEKPLLREKSLLREIQSVGSRNQSLISGCAYCAASCSMILLNKVVLSGYKFNAGISLMVYQNLVSVLIMYFLSATGVVTTEPITWKLVKVWFPVNVLFVCMLVTSIFSLRLMNVAMVTILKNVTNLITAVGEIYFFSKHHNNEVWLSLILMVVSAFSGGVTDLSFQRQGYIWQVLNCFCTSAYSLRLRKVMDIAKRKTSSGTLNEASMVVLNNLLSIPLGVGLIFIFEFQKLVTSPALELPVFWALITLSGVLGLAISFTSMWFMHQTSPTTHSLVGSLNKIPLSLAGILLFRVPTSFPNLMSIFFGLFAGVMFARAKMSPS